MADLGRLQHAVTREHPEGFTLVFVDDIHPPFGDEDHLETDPMEVDPVRHVTAVIDPDVTRDEPSSPAIRQEVPILHTGATHAESSVPSVHDGELRRDLSLLKN